MTFGWYRIKIEGFPAEPAKWDQLLRDEVLPFLARLEECGRIARFFILNEPGNPFHTMVVFFGEIDEVMRELQMAGLYQRLIQTGPAEHPLYEFYDLEKRQKGRFGSHYMLGVALFELGTRFAMVSRLGQKPKDDRLEILAAFRHAFCHGLLMQNMPADPLAHELDPLLEKIYLVLTRQYPEAWNMVAP